MRSIRLRGLLALGALMGSFAGFAQPYHAYDLTPTNGPAALLNAVAAGVQAGAVRLPDSYNAHATLFTGSAFGTVDLHPAPTIWNSSMVTSVGGGQQGGWGSLGYGTIHALLWTGTAAGFVDLHPPGENFAARYNTFSYCLGVDGAEQVGYVESQYSTGTTSFAILWHGTSASAVNLHPVGTQFYSRALGCRNGQQVGYVANYMYADGLTGSDTMIVNSEARAVLWYGSADTVVYLHPTGYEASIASCTSGTQQGGWVKRAGEGRHAALWSGDAATWVDLHPSGFTSSRVTSMSGALQVGEGWISEGGPVTYRHALLWTGSPESVVDLNVFLPAGLVDATATGIDESGNVVGYAYTRPGPNYSHFWSLIVPPDRVPVVWQVGPVPSGQLGAITVSPSIVAPGGAVQCTVSIGGVAPAGGALIQFLSTDPSLLLAPEPVVIPEGENQAILNLTAAGLNLTVPASVRLYASDATIATSSKVTVKPVVLLTSLVANAIEGGFTTSGTVGVNFPVQDTAAVVQLSSGNPLLVGLPATVSLPVGRTNVAFSIATAMVGAPTTVPVTATWNGTSVTGNLVLAPAPALSVVSVTAPEVVGGYAASVTVSLNTFPRPIEGATVSLTSSDPAILKAPVSMVIPTGASSATISIPTAVVTGRKGYTLTASLNGSVASTTVFVNPIPTVTIKQADYYSDTHELRITATTSFSNAMMTFGSAVTSEIWGTLNLEAGVFQGYATLATAPAQVTVWNQFGGKATAAVRVRSSTTTTPTTTNYKLSIATSGKGTVTTSPSGTAFASGTVVTLTATPAAGSTWTGWTGDYTGSSRTLSITITKDTKVTANFR